MSSHEASPVDASFKAAEETTAKAEDVPEKEVKDPKPKMFNSDEEEGEEDFPDESGLGGRGKNDRPTYVAGANLPGGNKIRK